MSADKIDALRLKIESMSDEDFATIFFEEVEMDNAGEFLKQFFSYAHLPHHLQTVSEPFGKLAEIVLSLPANPERTASLRKLLEAKDCAVRAVLAK